MNFQTMNKQRKFILIAAAAGIIGLLLPWVNLGAYGSVNGMHGSGIFMFILFLAAGGVTLLGNQTLPLEKTFWFGALAAGGINVLILLIGILGNLNAIGLMSFGFYVTIIAAIAVVYFAWQFRRPGDDISSGFNSLKGDVNKKMNSGNPPSNTNI